MTEVQYMREIENLEARNRKLSEALTACKIEVNRLQNASYTANRLLLEGKSLIEGYEKDMDQAADEIERLRAALEVTSSDCKEAFAENERLRAALEGK